VLDLGETTWRKLDFNLCDVWCATGFSKVPQKRSVLVWTTKKQSNTGGKRGGEELERARARVRKGGSRENTWGKKGPINRVIQLRIKEVVKITLVHKKKAMGKNESGTTRQDDTIPYNNWIGNLILMNCNSCRIPEKHSGQERLAEKPGT